MKNNDNNIYSTHDLGLATVLSLYLPIQRINKNNPRKVEFIFEKDEQIVKLTDCFWKKSLKIDALTFFNQLKVIKTRLYETNYE